MTRAMLMIGWALFAASGCGPRGATATADLAGIGGNGGDDAGVVADDDLGTDGDSDGKEQQGDWSQRHEIFSADFVRLTNKVSGARNNASQFVRSLSDASVAA